MSWLPRLRLLCGVLAVAIALGLFSAWRADFRPTLGITFSKVYARQLGVDPFEAFTALLDDLKVRNVRLPLYWSDIEWSPGEYHFDDYDRFVREAAARGAKLTLVVGQKVPRYPECFLPDWTRNLAEEARDEALFAFVGASVKRYRGETAVVRWQVENEPFFPFGVCPPPDPARVEREIALVRSLDSRPIQVSVSGEAEPWAWSARRADVVGASLYRITWNDLFGYFVYPLPPLFYAARAALVAHLAPVIVSELQAEPWFPGPMSSRTLEQWERAFDADDLRETVEYARLTHVREVSLWGAEWWFKLKKEGRPALWETARQIFAEPVL